MFCYYCGQEIPEDAAFCNQCGRKLQVTAATQEEGMLANSVTSPLSSSEIKATSYLYEQQTGPVRAQSASVVKVPLPPSSMQRLLVRVFQPALAHNAFFGILLGSIIAILVGTVASWLILTLTNAIFHYQALYGQDMAAILLGIVPLHTPFRDSLQLYLMMHGAGIHIQYETQTTAISAIMPLHGLLVLPALLLTFGGYIAASTDYQNRVQRNLLLGAGVAIPYTILLLLLASQVNGSISSANGGSGTSIATLSIDTPTLIGFGLLWGVLFGALGASLKLARGQWRHMLRKSMQSSPHPQIMGMIAGALSATGLGLGLSLLLICSFLAYSTYSSLIMGDIFCYSGDWQVMTFWGIVQGPLHALNLFFFSFSAPITIHNPVGGCFYGRASQAVLTLRDTNLHLPVWLYTLPLIPAISLFLGGRASVAVANVHGVGPRIVQGAGIALPFTILMLLLSLLGTITNTITNTATSSPSVAQVQSMGAGPGDLLLWALLFSGVVGAIGGVYQGSSLQIALSRAMTSLGHGMAVLATPGNMLLDRLSGLPRSSQRSSARSLLYGAFLVALLLAIVAGLIGGYLIASNQTLSFNDTLRIKDISSAVIVALVGIFLLAACAAALRRDPGADEQEAASTYH